METVKKGLAILAASMVVFSSAASASDIRPADSGVISKVQRSGVIRRGAPVRNANKAVQGTALLLLAVAGAAAVGGIVVIATNNDDSPASP